MFKNKISTACLLILFFNVFGSALLFFKPINEIVLQLTPINLLGILVLFLWANADYSFKLFKTISLIYIIGILVEVLGVNLNIIFGDYYYGNSLGPKIYGTPLIIGVNWLTLSIATYGISSYIFRHNTFIILFASIFMVFTDYIIEPLAGVLDFWHWSLEVIPIQNYIAWFFVSLIIQLILVKGNFKFNIKLCCALIFSQILFFIIQYFNYGLF